MKKTRKSSKYHGVSRGVGQRWRAYIRVKGYQISLGSYLTQVDAARAYNKAALKYFGRQAVLNKVKQKVKK